MELTALWTMLVAVLVAALLVFGLGLFYYASVFIHELGHLIAAFFVGWKPARLCIGYGKRRTLFSFLGVDCEVGERLRGGFAYAYPSRLSGFRTSLVLFALGGPVASGCSAYVLFLLAQESGFSLASKLSSEWIWFFFLLEAAMVVQTLWPYTVEFSGERLPSDGLIMWRTFWMKKGDLGQWFFGYVLAHATHLLGKGRISDAQQVFDNGAAESGLFQSADSNPRVSWINLLLEVGLEDEARAECRQLLDRSPAGTTSRAEVLDELACIPLFYGQRRMLPEAIEFIEQAIAEAPDKITLKGTKGSLLIENGEVEEGMRLINQVIDESDSENDRGICVWYLAFGYQKQGNVLQAQETLHFAKAKYPDCIVARRIEAEIWASPLGHVEAKLAEG